MMISYLKDIKCPEYIILNTTNELNTFIDSVQKYINKDDIIELITQVFEKILNNEENITFNYNRLINNNIEIYKIDDNFVINNYDETIFLDQDKIKETLI